MLLDVSAVLVVVAVAVLIVQPTFGVPLLLLVRPIVDATWAQAIAFDVNLPMVLGVLVPTIVLLRGVLRGRHDDGIGRMPLALPWFAFSLYVLTFSAIIAFVDGWLNGVDVFFRHINGIVGFFMLQAWFHDDAAIRRLMLAIAAAGTFPLAIGLYQIATGYQWTDAQVEGLTRNVGLYHDAFTVRFYMMQTLLALVIYGGLHPRLGPLRMALVLGYGVLAFVVLFKAYSKSAMATLLLWGVVWMVLRRRFLWIGTVGVIAAGASLIFAVDPADQIAQLFNKELAVLGGQGDVRLTFQGRWFAWAEMLDEWRSYAPLQQVFGSGYKSIGSHNDYLQLLLHGGIVGVSLYVALLGAVGVRVARNLRRDRGVLNLAAAMAFVMWLIDSIGLVPSAYPPYQWFVWGVIGLAIRRDAERVRGSAEIAQPRRTKFVFEPAPTAPLGRG